MYTMHAIHAFYTIHSPTVFPIARHACKLNPPVTPSTLTTSHAKYNQGQIVDSSVFGFIPDVSTHHAVTNSSHGRRLTRCKGIPSHRYLLSN